MERKNPFCWTLAALALFCFHPANALEIDTLEVSYMLDDVDVDGGDDDGDGFSLQYTRGLNTKFLKTGSTFALGSYTRSALEDTLIDIEQMTVGAGLDIPLGRAENQFGFQGAVTFDHTVFGAAADNGLGFLLGLRAAFSPKFTLDGHFRQVFLENSDDTEIRFGASFKMTGGNSFRVQYWNRDFDVDDGADFDITSFMFGLSVPL